MKKKNKKLKIIILYILINFLLLWLFFIPILLFIGSVSFGVNTKKIDTHIVELGWIDYCIKYENILIALITAILIITLINVFYFTREKWEWW